MTDIEKGGSFNSSETGGGWVRDKTERLRNFAADTLLKINPELDANSVTLTSLGGTILAAYLFDRGYRTTGRIIGTAAQALDSIDGMVARKQVANGKRDGDEFWGDLLDSGSDRGKEAITNLTTARQNPSPVGRHVGNAAVLTGIAPSIARAYSESRGVKNGDTRQSLDQNGQEQPTSLTTKVLDILGSSVGRGGLSFLSSFGPRAQVVSHAIQTGANLRLAALRIRDAHTQPSTLSEEAKKKAKIRLATLGVISAGIIAAVHVSNSRIK